MTSQSIGRANASTVEDTQRGYKINLMIVFRRLILITDSVSHLIIGNNTVIFSDSVLPVTTYLYLGNLMIRIN